MARKASKTDSKSSKSRKSSKSKDAPAPARHYCDQPAMRERVFGPEVSAGRAALINLVADKWVNGTTLRYYFFDQEGDGEFVTFTDGSREWRSWIGAKRQQDVARRAFKAWKEVGIGLEFQEVDNREEAEVRIGFMQGDGAWSYLGRQILDQGKDARTMNFGWDLTRSDGLDTALHEIGHTIGFPHEHQNPNAGIVWDEEKVYRDAAGAPNFWSRDKTHWNIIRKIAPDQVQGTSWDKDSIMHYPFDAGLILEPSEFQTAPLIPAGGLSERDKTWARTLYPSLEERLPRLEPFQSVGLDLDAGEQFDAEIIPDETRTYTIQTFGHTDVVMVLFEDEDGELRYRKGDDDSGHDWNAKIEWKLLKGHRYVVRVRLFYSWARGASAIMMW